MNRGGSALARRLYLHLKNEGPLKVHDLERLVEIIEGLEEKVSDSEVLFREILDDNHTFGFTDTTTLNKIEKLLTKLEK